MSAINDGGPAFPVDGVYDEPRGVVLQYASNGMTMRDYFAAQAMQGLLAQSCGSAFSSNPRQGAEYAYRMADAMLAARETTS